MASNRQRLEALIEELPASQRPAFRRYLDTSRNNDEVIGIVADLVASGSVSVALDVIADNRLAAILVTLTGRIRDAFLNFVRDMKSPEVYQVVLQAVESGNIAAAMDIVDSHVVRLGSVISDTFTFTGKEITEDIAASIRGIRPSVAVTFNPGHPRAAAMMEEHSLDFINRVTTEQKDAIRTAVTDAVSRGAGPVEVATAYRDAIGLTDTQQAHVNNFRRLLESGTKEALTRDLRDRRFDKTIANAADKGKPLTPEQIDRMVDRYRERYLKYRSETISITEAGSVMSAANHEAFVQQVDALGASPGDVEKAWNSTRDGRTRLSHVLMQGQKVRGLETEFTTGAGFKLRYPHDRRGPASETIRCRCICSYRFKFESVEA